LSSRVAIADEAGKHLAEIQTHALEAGSPVFDVLMDELVHAVDLLEEQPEMGPSYPLHEGDLTRRIFLRASKHFIYYEYDESRDTVTITAVWYAGRGSPPTPRTPGSKSEP
jgi:plasmid stabilization system protein ParE